MQYPTYMPGPYGQPYQGFAPRQDAQAIQPIQQPTQPVQPQAMIQGLSGASRPVTSREEATGVPADFAGNLMVFPDIAHNRVYVKRWNFNTGSADFLEYAPVQPEQTEIPAAFASLQDFQNLQELVENLKDEIERIKKPNPAARPVKKEKGDGSSE